jgi:hypothetical protein
MEDSQAQYQHQHQHQHQHQPLKQQQQVGDRDHNIMEEEEEEEEEYQHDDHNRYDDVDNYEYDHNMILDEAMMMMNEGEEEDKDDSECEEIEEALTVLLDADEQQQQQQQQQQPSSSSNGLTGRLPILLYLSCNPDYLNEYQCYIRKNMEFFESTPTDIAKPVRGRNQPIQVGQVGLRCAHCRHSASKGSVYYPQTLLGIYQSAQALVKIHWLGPLENDINSPESCLPPSVRHHLLKLKQDTECQREDDTIPTPKKVSLGKQYWADTARALGVYELEEGGLRFGPSLSGNNIPSNTTTMKY